MPTHKNPTNLLAFPSFHPSPAQRRLLEFIHECPSFKTMQELCDGAGVPRRTYYSWCQKPEFRLWLATAWSARLLTDGVMLLNVGRVQSTRSYPYWKALFDLTFDPKGLGYLQQWQQNLAKANDDSFRPSDGPEPEGDSDPDPEGPSGVQSLPQQNQQPTDETCSDLAPAAAPRRHPRRPPLPHHVSRTFLRALDSRRRSHHHSRHQFQR